MNVKQLKNLLEAFHDDAEIVIRADISYPIFAQVLRVTPGAFRVSDYGNDFIPYDIFLAHGESRAVLIEALPEKDPDEPNEVAKIHKS